MIWRLPFSALLGFGFVSVASVELANPMRTAFLDLIPFLVSPIPLLASQSASRPRWSHHKEDSLSCFYFFFFAIV